MKLTDDLLPNPRQQPVTLKVDGSTALVVNADSSVAYVRGELVLAHILQLTKALGETRHALRELRISSNRLCDRQEGGTYEDDCRRSIAEADAVLLRLADAGSIEALLDAPSK